MFVVENSVDPDENHIIQHFILFFKRAQWLSGRVLDTRPRVRVSPASLFCVLEQDTLILA